MARTDFLKKVKFEFDEKIKDEYYTTDYFVKTRQIIKKFKNDQVVTMQFIHFTKQPIMVCGIEEVKQLLKKFLTRTQLSRIEVLAVPDGTVLKDSSYPIMTIKGRYTDFGYLENIIDGILARRTSVATNCYNAVQKLKEDQNIIFMADRNDDYINQKNDGYAAYIAGINYFVTQAQVEYLKDTKDAKVVGTMPHALIQQYKGDLSQVIDDYKKVIDGNVYALIDYHNDVINDLNTIKDQFETIDGVRLDTSKYLIDKSLEIRKIKEYGVNANLVKLVRSWLDSKGLVDKKIIVSSGITPQKIDYFNQQSVKVDTFGIGSFFLTPSVNITGDLVELDDQEESKIGRHLLDDHGLYVKLI